MSDWEIWLDESTGNRLELLTTVGPFSVTPVLNGVGYFNLRLPASFDKTKLKLDAMVEFWRKPAGGRLNIVRVGLIRYWDFFDQGGQDWIVIAGTDQNDLLARRIIAYDAGTAQAEMTGNTDNMLKEIARDNISSDAPAGRNLSAVAGGVSVQANLGDGPSITKSFSHQNVLQAMQGICDTSRQAGTELYFDLVPVLNTTTIGFQFRTKITQWGQDHTQGTSNEVIFSKENGNLAEPRLPIDYMDEKNYIYSGGQGEGTARNVREVYDTTRIGKSIWNRREGFADARNEDTDAGVDAQGNEALAAGRPIQSFQGKLLDSDKYRYGIDWNWGDRVTVKYQGFEMDGLIKSVTLGRDDAGAEICEARLEVETFL